MSNNKQQTAVELFIEELEEKGKAYEENEGGRTINISIDISDYMELKVQAKEMEKEQRAVEIQKFIDKVNEKIDRELGWCGGPRNKSSEMENWRKAYANVRKWMQNLNKEFQQTYGGGKQ
jgi:predicted RecB family endonuclease